MNEKDIMRVCLIVAFIGILIIYLADISFTPEKITGAAISKEIAGEKVLLCGKITDVSSGKSGTTFFKINDGQETDVVLFQDRNAQESLAKIKNGNSACVMGTVQEYKNRIEIVAEKIQ